MTIMGACLVAIGLLVVIWGVIETHGVDMTGIWLAGVAIAWYVGCMDMELIVKLMSFVVIAGLAAWLTTKLI